MPIEHTLLLSRRTLLQGAAAAAPFLAAGFWPARLTAQESGATPAAPQQFSFDLLTEQMRALAAQPFAPAAAPEGEAASGN